MTAGADWLIFGSRPRFANELAEIIARKGQGLIAAYDNLADEPEQSPPFFVIGRSGLATIDRGVRVAVAAGPGALRKQLAAEARAEGFLNFETLIDPTAVIASTARLGEGCVVNALAVIASHTTLSRFVQVNRSASIGHDVTLEAFATVGPGAVLTGFVEVGEGAFVGAGAVVRPRTTIGANSTVGAGAVVTRDVAENAIVVGNPARVVGENASGTTR